MLPNQDDHLLTYLFGAGASAQRVPLVSGIRDAFVDFYLHQTVSFLMYGNEHRTSERLESLIRNLYVGRSNELLGMIEWYCLRAAPDHQRINFGSDDGLGARLGELLEINFGKNFQSFFEALRGAKQEGRQIDDWAIIHAIAFDKWEMPTPGRGYFLHKVLTLILKSARPSFEDLVRLIDNELTNGQRHVSTQFATYFKPIFADVEFAVKTLDAAPKSTFDEICKFFYKIGQVEEFDRMKRSLTLMFLHLQNITYYRDVNDIGSRFSHADPRYDILFKKVGFDLLAADRLRILSWNYDHQIELSDINDGRYKTILPSIVGDQSEDEGGIFFKLNGALVLEEEDRFTLEMDGIDTIEALLSRKYLQIKDGLSHISFAFEGQKNLEKVLPKVSETQVLVAIGYSFPEDNIATDKAILEEMHNLKEIYVQLPADPCRDVIQRLSNKYLGGREVKYHEVTDLREFHIPNDV